MLEVTNSELQTMRTFLFMVLGGERLFEDFVEGRLRPSTVVPLIANSGCRPFSR